jgi:hypothetical protein
MSSVTSEEQRGLDRLLHAAATVRVPADVRAAFDAEPGDPRSGQLWRARWDEVVEILLILDVYDDGVAVAPVSLDDRLADERTVILEPHQTSLGTTVAVWNGLVRQLPVYVLDRQVGAVAGMTDAWVEEATAGGAAIGRVANGPLDPLIPVRAELGDALQLLADATWAPSGTGELSTMLASASVSPQQLVGLLNMPPQRAIALARGQIPATAEDAAVLAPLLQLPARDVLEANPAPPANLVRRMSRPRRRAQVSRFAAQRGIDERSAWLTTTYAIGAQAARQTGEATDPVWDDRIDRYFQITLEP